MHCSQLWTLNHCGVHLITPTLHVCMSLMYVQYMHHLNAVPRSCNSVDQSRRWRMMACWFEEWNWSTAKAVRWRMPACCMCNISSRYVEIVNVSRMEGNASDVSHQEMEEVRTEIRGDPQEMIETLHCSDQSCMASVSVPLPNPDSNTAHQRNAHHSNTISTDTGGNAVNGSTFCQRIGAAYKEVTK